MIEPSPAMDLETLYAEFGRRVKQLRERQGLTQVRLAEALGMSRTSITNIEVGRQRVLLHQLLRLAEILKVHPVDLLPPHADAREGPPAKPDYSDRTLAWLEKAKALAG
jgi:transcriptional regulator with XRE-family HTH domain